MLTPYSPPWHKGAALCRTAHAVSAAAQELAALCETAAGCAEARHALPLIVQGHLATLWTAPAALATPTTEMAKLPSPGAIFVKSIVNIP